MKPMFELKRFFVVASDGERQYILDNTENFREAMRLFNDYILSGVGEMDGIISLEIFDSNDEIWETVNRYDWKHDCPG